MWVIVFFLSLPNFQPAETEFFAWQIACKAPSHISVSVEQFPHSFVQSSIIARISPPRTPRNISQPLTIIGAHQDSANYYFPSLPAPGADDDLSGTTSILEAFRALVEQGFEPKDGPVEFHWYAAEEGGLLGSLDIAEDYSRRGLKIGAMMEYVSDGTRV
jgi:bacterial leucyl aminopeptidase